VVHRAERVVDDPARPPVAACKVLHPSSATRPNVVASFRFETRVLGRLDHPSFPKVVSSGATGDSVYLMMELVDGVEMDRFLMKQRPTLHESLDLIGQLAGAVDHLHDAGYVHRDIKPGNLVLTGDGRLVLLDFGTVMRAGASTSYERGFYGTVGYLAPEQALGGARVGPRADLYAVAALAYRLLTGHRHFDGTREDVLHALLHAEPEPPSRRARIAPTFDPVFESALARDPDGRHPTAAAFLSALHEAAGTPPPSRRRYLLSRLRRSERSAITP
jgi:serine/threonine-protein kinase